MLRSLLIVLLTAAPALAGATVDAGRGPVPVRVPPSYEPDVPTPLVIMLHGYMTSGDEVEAWVQLGPLADTRGYLYLTPDGTSDFLSNPFWNATSACCDLFGNDPDDSGYLFDLIQAVQMEFNVDPARIHLVGHSNGGFMAYRMACDYPEMIASIASLAGATYLDPLDCGSTSPVHVLQIHGTADAVIGYDGGCVFLMPECHPGAIDTVEQWALRDGCTLRTEPRSPLDIDASIPGAETTGVRYVTDCATNGSVEFWTIQGGPHSPNLTSTFSEEVIDFLFAHPKAQPCPTDLDTSGATDFTDLLAVLAAWGSCRGCDQDLDGSGDVGFSDLLALLSAWGPCAG